MEQPGQPVYQHVLAPHDTALGWEIHGDIAGFWGVWVCVLGLACGVGLAGGALAVSPWDPPTRALFRPVFLGRVSRLAEAFLCLVSGAYGGTVVSTGNTVDWWI